MEDQITGDFTRAEIPNIDSISSKQELEEKIHQRKILITTIFKFGDLNDGEVIDERDNIILLMDEAHRTQEGDWVKDAHSIAKCVLLWINRYANQP